MNDIKTLYLRKNFHFLERFIIKIIVFETIKCTFYFCLINLASKTPTINGSSYVNTQHI